MSADILASINFLPEQLPPDPHREYLKSHVGQISKYTAEVLIGIFAAMATIAVAFRLVIQLRSRGKLYLDDFFVLAATVFLLVETGLLYHLCSWIWIEQALAINPMNFVLFTRSEIMSLLTFLDSENAWLAVAWTSIYLVKLSFLAFFYKLVRNVSRNLTVFWWAALVVSTGAWVFTTFENIINCGTGSSMRCFPYPRHNIAIGISSSVVDVLSDLMILSIPILLLRNSQLRTGQKYRILAFLCLSVFMIAFAIARAFGGMHRDYAGVLTFHATWAHVWLHLEASVAVIMGGLTAFRTMFSREVRSQESSGSSKAINHYIRRLFRKSPGNESSVATSQEAKGPLQGPIAGASMKGLRTFIRRNNREPGHTTIEESMINSKYDPLESYHNFQREHRKSRAVSSTEGSKGSGGSGYTEELRMPEYPLPVLQTHNIV
ncbi:hypothetical protein BCR34DRAFT_139961 [Clohesyomyces aquaticus]|uniref:Rhodopsin domain-containing protein n=1 Tax=Clohesyomyces aquaticus TaxID=1231657 RepID=A0A1Y1YMF5_9PLEO|nr:hypothetical protein BCR34DRAFT_139961 [Clohesyomyces aquaticus]